MNDYHKILFPYAYNLLGSTDDAQDAIQDVLTNYISSNPPGIENEKAYLIKSVINQSINYRNKRKKLIMGDVWLPEPIATEKADKEVYLKDIASYSLLLLIERLTAKERAAFILKEAFNYSHQEISIVLDTSIENSRKLLSRAKNKIRPSIKNESPKPAKAQLALVDDYVRALRSGDVEQLEKLLSKDILFYADGGKSLNVVKKYSEGVRDVSEVLRYVFNQYQTNLTIKPLIINHSPALLYYKGNELISCQVFEFLGDQICSISNILDPDKLKTLTKEGII